MPVYSVAPWLPYIVPRLYFFLSFGSCFRSRCVFSLSPQPPYAPIMARLYSPLSLLLTLVIFISPCCVAAISIPRHHLQMRQQYNPNPAVGGSPETGWESMPDVQDATAYRDWVVDAEAGAVMVRTIFRSRFPGFKC